MILGEYFTEDTESAETAEEATDLIGWILNHGRVHCVFDEVQAEISYPTNKVLALLIANITRWATHFIAFDRLFTLKDPLQRAVISRRDDIISAQVGAEKNRQKKQKLEDDATNHCELIDDSGFWRRLKCIVDDLEPICLGLNMNQSDAMRPDQALLTFAGIFLHFQRHSKPSVAEGMMKRIEKRWKALDQPMFVLALVLNPFEGISRFGDKAAVSPFTLNTILLEVPSFALLRNSLILIILHVRHTAASIHAHPKLHGQRSKSVHIKTGWYNENERSQRHFLAT